MFLIYRRNTSNKDFFLSGILVWFPFLLSIMFLFWFLYFFWGEGRGGGGYVSCTNKTTSFLVRLPLPNLHRDLSDYFSPESSPGDFLLGSSFSSAYFLFWDSRLFKGISLYHRIPLSRDYTLFTFRISLSQRVTLCGISSFFRVFLWEISRPF